MATLYQDMSRISPAPTLKRETASFIANAVVVVAFFAVMILVFDLEPVTNSAIGGAVLAALGLRWIYVARRGDQAES